MYTFCWMELGFEQQTLSDDRTETRPLSVAMFPETQGGFGPSQQATGERRFTPRTGSVRHGAGHAVIAPSPLVPRIQDSEDNLCNHFWMTVHAPLNDHMCSETKIFSPHSCVWVGVLVHGWKNYPSMDFCPENRG